MTEGARQNKRYPTNRPLAVRCTDWAEFVRLYATDIGQGGVFIATEEPPAMLSIVEVKIQLPEGHELLLQARIVHVIAPEQAQAGGLAAGVGVQFEDMSPETRSQLHQLVEFARWEGSSDNPSSSYASHMFEMTESRSASEVMQSLPMKSEALAADPQVSRPPRTSRTTRSKASAVIPSEPESDPKSEAAPDPEAPKRFFDGRNTGRMRRQPAGKRSHAEIQAASDEASMQVGMQHLAHKRFGPAVTVLTELTVSQPQNQEAKKWLCLAQARQAKAKPDSKTALAAYKRLLDLDDSNREARDYVRDAGKDARLASVPFSRFFKKK